MVSPSGLVWAWDGPNVSIGYELIYHQKDVLLKYTDIRMPTPSVFAPYKRDCGLNWNIKFVAEWYELLTHCICLRMFSLLLRWVCFLLTIVFVLFSTFLIFHVYAQSTEKQKIWITTLSACMFSLIPFAGKNCLSFLLNY